VAINLIYSQTVGFNCILCWTVVSLLMVMSSSGSVLVVVTTIVGPIINYIRLSLNEKGLL
jgi:heme/copper-type cytochrome/quinol oxidase subunit 4